MADPNRFKQQKIGPRTFRCAYLGDDEKKRMCFRIIDHDDIKKFKNVGCWGNVVKAKFPANALTTSHPPNMSPISAKFVAYSYESADSKGVYWRFDSWIQDEWKNNDDKIWCNQMREPTVPPLSSR